MNRRHFLGTAGAFAGTVIPSYSAPAPGTGQRNRISLNGTWDQSVAGERLREVLVPSSLRPSGSYALSRRLPPLKLGAQERAILHFEAIALLGRASCNGQALGEMNPYVPYEFDITSLLRERDNTVKVDLVDLVPEGHSGKEAEAVELGVNPGWEAYGGIIRDCWIEVRPSTFIENVRLSYQFEPGLGAAQCTARVWLNSKSPTSGAATITLERAGRVLANIRQDIPNGQLEFEVAFRVGDLVLWAPETPDLYNLLVKIQTPAGPDEYSCRTGFRDFRAVGSTFELNGKRIILNGVCRHDMWKDQGFTLTRAQMRADMEAIKGLGANYVRLVHYPHDRYIVELADELGLLVSEEPGYWQVDFQKASPGLIGLGLDILEAAIRRDWNAPSVVLWLLANESRVTTAFLSEGKARCRKLDPLRRLVTAANDKRKEDIKPMFETAGMEFFDQHPYTVNVQQFREIAEFYGAGKPLMFTEWGGKEIGQAPHIMPHTVDMLLELQAANQLAGTAFWSWQDVPEFSRVDPEMQDGILQSGVVTESREPRSSVAMELRRLFEGKPPAEPEVAKPAVLPLRSVPWAPDNRIEPVSLEALAGTDSQRRSWLACEEILSKYWPTQPFSQQHWDQTGKRFRLWHDQLLEIAGARFRTSAVDGFARPLVLTPNEPVVTIPVNRICSAIHILGHVSLVGGYPTSAEEGIVAATLELKTGTGTGRSIPIRHGYESAQGNLIFRAGRIDAIATLAQPAVHFVKDAAREHYQFLLYTVPMAGQRLESLTYRLSQEEKAPLLILAISTESA